MFKKKLKRMPKEVETGIYGIDKMELSKKKCIPCEGGIPPLNEEECNVLRKEIDDNWKVISLHHLEREWLFDDFINALNFTNKLGGICEEENHHADFELGWGRVKVKIFTHKIDGLAEADFILAAKFDCLD